MEHFQHLLDQYGYWILGIALMLEVLALPLPGEFLMSYTGLLIFQGRLSWPVAILAAALGSSIGVTAAYWIGFAVGRPFFEKVGPKIHLGPDKLDKVSSWFDRYGNKVLLIAYYIPGVRHFTGYFAGVTRLPFRTFAVYAYTGALVWTSLFITLGKILGPQWEQFHESIQKYLVLAAILAAVFLLVFYIIRKKREQFKTTSLRLIEKGLAAFHSSKRLEWAVGGSFVVCVGTVTWALYLIQRYLRHEYSEFDELAPIVIRAVFDGNEWRIALEKSLGLLTGPWFLLPLIVTALAAIGLRHRDSFLAYIFYGIGLVGGVLGENLLRRLLDRTGPEGEAYSFPSEPVIVAAIALGLSAYFAGRAARPGWIKPILAAAVLAACLLVGIAAIDTGRAYATDVSAAYAFGGGWISSVVVLFEVALLIHRTLAPSQPPDAGRKKRR
ncbi:DedA family protein [Cohnella zeiphila]|uniref:VTT domain-containing protein n=1 Tax=Cohnella zeiphila TaxID=2761120 RepID=A0A7X0VYB3_9BACL|nr:DedA family protein [Cohnella zeiphila]MBB6734302.1 VTT domain-containing protein [Cohnella zeiphila]